MDFGENWAMEGPRSVALSIGTMLHDVSVGDAFGAQGAMATCWTWGSSCDDVGSGEVSEDDII